MTKPQRRGRAIAMTGEEIDAYLRTQRTCRVATVGADGRPHVSALWFVWDGECLWLNSLTRSQRWTDLERDPRVAVVVDDGHEFLELRGVELSGSVETVGDVPRTATPHEVLAPVEEAFAAKYSPGMGFTADGRHAWVRLRPEAIVSWDFTKIQLS
jgi:PPOX class probable F420-dependent enzyme